MITTTKSNIVNDEMFLRTSEVFAKQSMLSEEDIVNNWLDEVNNMKIEFQRLFDMFEPYLEKVVNELSGDLDKQGLIIRNEYLTNVTRSIAKLVSTISKRPKTNSSFKSDKETLQIFHNDLSEIITDIGIRISPNAEVDELLGELSDF